MSASISRRTALTGVPFIMAAPWLVRPVTAAAAHPAPESADFFPSHDPRLVREMVGAAHSKLDRVRELLKDTPRLANAAWDAGFGDWETPLGAASHVGRREIALLLLDHGARPDVFCFAMLGNLAAVRAMIEARPGLERVRGPHGLTLAHHARAGGETSVAVLEYLKTLEGSDIPYVDLPIDEKLKAGLVGEYASAGSLGTRFSLKLRPLDQRFTIERTGVDVASPRLLFHQGENVFHPAGAPEVRVAMGVESGVANRMRIASTGGVVLWEGERM